MIWVFLYFLFGYLFWEFCHWINEMNQEPLEAGAKTFVVVVLLWPIVLFIAIQRIYRGDFNAED